MMQKIKIKSKFRSFNNGNNALPNPTTAKAAMTLRTNLEKKSSIFSSSDMNYVIDVRNSS